MNRTVAVDPPVSLPGYDLTQRIYAGSKTLVYRGIRLSSEADPAQSKQPVVLKLLKNDYPTFSELLQFRNQYTITKNLNSPAIIQAYSLEFFENRYVLVMEDYGGISLQDYIQTQPIGITDWLQIARQLTDILHDLIQHRVVHKDIKPANILIHPETKQVKLIDFSIASLLPKETQEIQNPNVLEGTLAYLAPEQTGRMNRGIDYRTDFYGLGVTLYELLTGTLPFQSDDPMELVHCHIAQTPVPPWKVWGIRDKEDGGEVASLSASPASLPSSSSPSSGIPKALSDVVMKLMAKNAENRYQSALGLKHDLERCLTQWKEVGKIEDFELGQRDVGDRFLIPEKLYGREAEVQALLDAFDRVAGKQSELLLVAGFSGIGKTAVINEVHKPITRQHGYFIKGKFDQFNRNIPFSAFVQAFRSLMGQLLGESDTDLADWKAKILAAVGESGQVLAEVIPELERIIGVQPTVLELSGSAAQNRFNVLFSKFVRVFTTQDHPLVIFLDDLQWVDSASLNLLKLLMAEKTGYLLVLGAYRDNEVFAAHPLMLALDEIGKDGANLRTLTLEPLAETNINQLVADTLLCSVEVAAPLAQLVYQKTTGNPFFSTQFLQGLHGDGWITFVPDAGCWQCELAQVRQLALTDDVVAFMVGRLQKLPEATQAVLKLAACIGNYFDSATLAVVCEASQDVVAADLWQGLQAGFVVPESETYKFFQGEEKTINVIEDIAVGYRFLHDRVQQAAYELIPEADKQMTHLDIGRLFLHHFSSQEQEEKMFLIVKQFNQSSQLIDNLDERERVAELNLIAGRKARAATAYASAVKYASYGIQNLKNTCWKTQYKLAFDLYHLAVESSYLTGNIEQMEAFADATSKNTQTILDKAQINEIKILSLIVQRQFDQALQLGIQTLSDLGIIFPTAPSEPDIQKLLEQAYTLIPKSGIASLLDLPVMTDRQSLYAMRIMNAMVAPAYQTRGDLLVPIFLFPVQLSINHGNSNLSPFFYLCYSSILCVMSEDIETGSAFNTLALDLLNKSQSKVFHSRAYLMATVGTIHWTTHLRESVLASQSGIDTGWESGDLESTAWSCFYHSQASYFVGEKLSDLSNRMLVNSRTIQQLKQPLQFDYNEIFRQVVLNLLGECEDPCLLIGEAIDEDQLIADYQPQSIMQGLFCIFLHKSILSYLFRQYSQTLEYVQQAVQYSAGVVGQVVVPVLTFYHSLAIAQLYVNQPKAVQEELLESLRLNQAKLRFWSSYAPMNFEHKFHLVEAEQNRILGQTTRAIDFYERAITGARENGYIQEEALVNELAAKFYLAWNKGKIAAVYMQEAYYCYARWGAKAKTDDLEKHYPHLLQPILQQPAPSLNPLETLSQITPTLSVHTSTKAPTSSSGGINTTLDLAAILTASQSLSSTIQLDELLVQLTQIILQNSGGDRCALILPDLDGIWHVVAIATPKNTDLRSDPLDKNPNLPTKLIQYVKNTQQVVVIDEGDTDLPTVDDYLIHQQPKSVLGLPLLNQGHLIGILHLENRTTRGVFTQERILILNFLCTQAAISLENARLYKQSQTYAQQLEQSQLQIVQSEKMSALGNLVAGVAHEMNNPIGFISGNVTELKLNLADMVEHLNLYQTQASANAIEQHAQQIDLTYLLEDMPKILASMETGCNRIRTISTSLRTFSRADKETQTAFNIHDGIDSTLLILKHRLKANDDRPAIQVFKEYGSLSEIQCFPGQLNQVFMNILANAIDVFDEVAQQSSLAKLKDKPQNITIQTAAMPEQNAVEIRIRDNGKGMNDDVQSRIFDHLFTTKEPGKGTGLGLAIAYQIVTEAHRGSLTVQSEIGKGTEFCLRLPISEE